MNFRQRPPLLPPYLRQPWPLSLLLLLLLPHVYKHTAHVLDILTFSPLLSFSGFQICTKDTQPASIDLATSSFFISPPPYFSASSARSFAAFSFATSFSAASLFLLCSCISAGGYLPRRDAANQKCTAVSLNGIHKRVEFGCLIYITCL